MNKRDVKKAAMAKAEKAAKHWKWKLTPEEEAKIKESTRKAREAFAKRKATVLPLILESFNHYRTGCSTTRKGTEAYMVEYLMEPIYDSGICSLLSEDQNTVLEVILRKAYAMGKADAKKRLKK